VKLRRDVLGLLAAVAPLLIGSYSFRHFNIGPTNDDWIYARTTLNVSHSIADGSRPVWTAHNGQVPAAAVTPIYLAGVWSALTGFSWEKLLVVTQILAGVGVAGTYLLVRAFGGGVVVASLTSWTLLFCPWFWGHAFTFMTDASGAGLAAAAAAAMACGIAREQKRWLIAGSLLLSLAVLTRQTTLALLMLPAVAFLLGKNRDFGRFAFCAAAPLASLGLLEIGWFGPGSLDRAAFVVQRPPLQVWLRDLAYAAYGMLLVVGFSMIPLAGLLLGLIRWTRRTQIAGAVGLLPAVFFVLRGGRAILTSATGPSVQNAHFGPILLSDCFELGRWGDIGGVTWPTTVWFLATLLSFASLVIIAAASENSFSAWWFDRADRRAAVEVGLWSSGVGAGVGLLILMGFSFDRYWLAVIGPLIGWAAVRLSPQAHGLPSVGLSALASSSALVSLLAFFALDVVFTHDWLAFNDTRWSLVQQLRQEGFLPEQIDGGYEVNGWVRSREDPLTRPRPGGESARWWSEKAERFLAVGPRPGMVEVERATWTTWAAGRPVPVLVLKRCGPAPSTRRPPSSPGPHP